MITADQVDFFEENGFLRLSAVYTPEETARLADELDVLIQDWSMNNEGWTGPWRNVYMNPEVEKKSKLIHLQDLHFYSEAWCNAVTKKTLTSSVATLLKSNVELHHSTLHVKPPETGMPFPLHQDSPFFQHQGFGFVDAIVHLDDTNDENGSLRFVPGSHKHGHIPHVTSVDGVPCSPHLPTDEWSMDLTVPCHAKAGDVVIFSIYTVHGSYINKTNRWRRLVRIGYRDPLNLAVPGAGLETRTGVMVHGLRPLGARTPA